MDLGEIVKTALTVILAAFSAVGSLYAYINRGREEDKQEIEKRLLDRDKRLDTMEKACVRRDAVSSRMSERLAALDARMEAMPSAEDFAELRSDVGSVGATLKAVEKNVDRLTDYLMQKEDK